MDEGAFVLDYFLPAGTSLDATEHYARELETELRATPEVRTFSRRTGAELGPAAATQANRGDIMVRLVPRGQRKRSADDVIADVRARVEKRVPEVRIEFVQVLQDVLNDLSGNPRPIEVKVFGPDYAKLHEIASDIAARVRRVDGLVDLYAGEERHAPELRFSIDRDAASRFGDHARRDIRGARHRASRTRRRVGASLRSPHRRARALPESRPLRSRARSSIFRSRRTTA